MPSLQNLNIAQGRGFTEADEEHASHVAIIGTDIQDNLFAGIDPLGQELRVDGHAVHGDRGQREAGQHLWGRARTTGWRCR